MRVVEIFSSIDGEGIRAGAPTTFIRLFGCNLHCSYCDTRYACDDDQADYTVLSIPEIMQQVEDLGIKRITITGGEPMIHPGIHSLVDHLICSGYEVNIETNGTVDPYHIPESCGGNGGRLFYTMDWKCKSSDMEEKMSIDRVNKLTYHDVLKFVVGSVEDMDGALSVMEQMTSKPQIFFSPVFGKIEPKDIVDYIITKQLYDCRVQIQMHKIIWDPNKRGV